MVEPSLVSSRPLDRDVASRETGLRSPELVRQDGLPWVRLVLSLLLLGAPALGLALEAAAGGPYVTGYDQSARGGCERSDLPRGCQRLEQRSTTTLQKTMVATPWRTAIRQLDVATHTFVQSHRWLQLPVFSHGRMIDPSQYLQRTLR